MLARDGVGVRDGMGVVVEAGVRLRLGVIGISGTLNSGASGAFEGFFNLVVDDNAEFDLDFFMPLALTSAGSAGRFLVFAVVAAIPLVSDFGSEILEERRRDISRTSFRVTSRK